MPLYELRDDAGRVVELVRTVPGRYEDERLASHPAYRRVNEGSAAPAEDQSAVIAAKRAATAAKKTKEKSSDGTH